MSVFIYLKEYLIIFQKASYSRSLCHLWIKASDFRTSHLRQTERWHSPPPAEIRLQWWCNRRENKSVTKQEAKEESLLDRIMLSVHHFSWSSRKLSCTFSWSFQYYFSYCSGNIFVVALEVFPITYYCSRWPPTKEKKRLFSSVKGHRCTLVGFWGISPVCLH